MSYIFDCVPKKIHTAQHHRQLFTVNMHSDGINVKINLKHLCDVQKLIPRLSVVTGQPVMGLVENIIANISHILIVTNSAVNIVVYAMKVSSGWWRDNTPL